MKTLIIALLISLSFSSFSFAGDMSQMALENGLQQLSEQATKHMSNIYSSEMSEDITVEAKAGLRLLEPVFAEGVLKDAKRINSSDSLEELIEDTNTLTPFSAPVFTRSTCCGCGDCPAN